MAQNSRSVHNPAPDEKLKISESILVDVTAANTTAPFFLFQRLDIRSIMGRIPRLQRCHTHFCVSACAVGVVTAVNRGKWKRKWKALSSGIRGTYVPPTKLQLTKLSGQSTKVYL